MATKIQNDISSWMTSIDLATITISTDKASVEFGVSVGGKTVFSSRYVPDASGRVAVYGMDKIIDRHIPEGGSASVSFLIDGTAAATASVVRCNVWLGVPGSEFMASHFLTPVTEERDSGLGRYESLSVIGSARTDVTATYITGDMKLRTRVFSNIQPVETVAGVRTFNVSPKLFNDFSIGDLVALKVTNGNRVQRYRVLTAPPAHDPALVFRNCFGCWDTAYFVGQKTTVPEYSRSTAEVNGAFVMYDNRETLKHTASTGPMRYGMDRLVRDLARSKAVFLLELDGSPGEQAVITDCNVKHSNTDDFAPQYSITYRMSSRSASDFEAIPPYRIFDMTFDITYE